MSVNRISATRPEDVVKTNISDLISGADKVGTGRVFYLGQVVDSNDPDNGNRLRVRIPMIDDVYYLNDSQNLTKTEGHDKLPWCIPSNTRFIDTPENGSVVLVGLFDPANPYQGRMWLNSFTKLEAKELFDSKKLSEEENEGWKNAELAIELNYGNTPGVNDRPTFKTRERKINYQVGVRGKDNNMLLFDEKKTTIVQNYKTREETIVELTENFELMTDKIKFLSKNNQMRHEPVFADPLFNFMQQQLALIGQIVTILSTMPGISPFLGLPVLPNPASASAVSAYSQLMSDFATLRLPDKGKSANIKIN
jgi:hypothetical protein